MTIYDFLGKHQLNTLNDLFESIKKYGDKLPVELVYQAAEYLNPNRDLTAAFYTDTAICKHIMAELPDFENLNHLRVLEPSAGAGNFIPFIIERYKDKDILELYLVDIDEAELNIFLFTRTS